jgi:hypothetical protein
MAVVTEGIIRRLARRLRAVFGGKRPVEGVSRDEAGRLQKVGRHVDGGYARIVDGDDGRGRFERIGGKR